MFITPQEYTIFKFLKLSIYTFLLFINNLVFAQVNEINLAHEYLLNEEPLKAKILFEKLSKKNENIIIIYDDYYKTLLQLNNNEDLDKFLKKAIKVFPDNVFYKIDHYVVLNDLLKIKSDNSLKAIYLFTKNNPNDSKRISEAFIKNNKLNNALETYKIARKALNQPHIFAFEIADLYKKNNQIDLVIEELLNLLKEYPDKSEEVKNSFQNNISDQASFNQLESILYQNIQKNPDKIIFNELLLWLNIQQKNFNKAYVQAKAIDKREKNGGKKLLEVGKIAMENKDYENSLLYFQTICSDYAKDLNYPVARRFLINSKEELIKNTYPINSIKILELIDDYKLLIKDIGKNQNTLDAMRNIALLEAFYLDKKDSAVTHLNEAIVYAGRDDIFLAKIKIDLADIYLLKDEPWESTLLYSQVEKAQKDESLGHEAKLKNAKLQYFKGEFQLAQEHLDVLKLATSREIANDAMNLSIFIQDNLGLDSTSEALTAFAEIEKLLFQHKEDLALNKIDSMEIKYPGHSLSDDILFLKAKLYRKQSNYDKALNALEMIQIKYATDILGDDALHLMGIIFEENKKDVDNAMKTYQEFLLKYPGSIFNVEVRKRFRSLRGDKL